MKKLLLSLVMVCLFFSCDNGNMENDEEKKFTITYYSEGHTSGEVPVDLNTYSEDDLIQLLPKDSGGINQSDIEELKEYGLILGSLEKDDGDGSIYMFEWNVKEAVGVFTEFGNALDTAAVRPLTYFIKINKNITVYAIWTKLEH